MGVADAENMAMYKSYIQRRRVARVPGTGI